MQCYMFKTIQKHSVTSVDSTEAQPFFSSPVTVNIIIPYKSQKVKMVVDLCNDSFLNQRFDELIKAPIFLRGCSCNLIGLKKI